MSLNDFIADPTLGNFGWLALDTVGLLPIIPGIGTVRHAGKLGRVDNIADAARYAGRTPGCAINSFTEGTLVHTENGLLPIETIRQGDKLYAQDPETGEQGYFEVTAVFSHPTDEILRITVDDDGSDTLPAEVMEITPGHPVYVEGQGWVNAEDLVTGDRLRRADGGFARVLAIERVVLDAPVMVYNFTVKGVHTYFVLEVGVLVHNCGSDPPQITSWTPRGPANHSRDLQRAFISGLEDGEVIAVRGMDWGVWSWERKGVHIPFKPMAATKTIFKGPHGYRKTNAGIFLADADVAWAIKFDPDEGAYRLIDNHEFHNNRRLIIKDAFERLGHKVTPVLHGPHMNVELMFKVQGKTAENFGGHGLDFFQSYYKADVNIYGRNYDGTTGYLGVGKMEDSLNKYAPKWREIGDGGEQISKYKAPANPRLDPTTRSKAAEY